MRPGEKCIEILFIRAGIGEEARKFLPRDLTEHARSRGRPAKTNEDRERSNLRRSYGHKRVDLNPSKAIGDSRKAFESCLEIEIADQFAQGLNFRRL